MILIRFYVKSKKFPRFSFVYDKYRTFIKRARNTPWTGENERISWWNITKVQRAFKSLNSDTKKVFGKLQTLREFWHQIYVSIDSEKQTIGGSIDIDQAFYCANASQSGRFDTI